MHIRVNHKLHKLSGHKSLFYSLLVVWMKQQLPVAEIFAVNLYWSINTCSYVQNVTNLSWLVLLNNPTNFICQKCDTILYLSWPERPDMQWLLMLVHRPSICCKVKKVRGFMKAHSHGAHGSPSQRSWSCTACASYQYSYMVRTAGRYLRRTHVRSMHSTSGVCVCCLASSGTNLYRIMMYGG